MAEAGNIKGNSSNGVQLSNFQRAIARRSENYATWRNGRSERRQAMAAAMRTRTATPAAAPKRFETPDNLPQATIDNAKLNRAVGRAASMTNENQHQYARRVLSRAFGYDDLTSEYSSIIREHERAGHLTQPLSERVDNADNEMFRRIRMQYGDDILRRVYRGL